MANLEFYDTHNMIDYLKKTEGSEGKGFHQIVDFLNSSHIRTLDNGEIEITATIDGKVKIVSEASIRRHLKLEDSDGPTLSEVKDQQSNSPDLPTQTNVADEAASTGVDVRHGWAATTLSSLDVGQGSEVQGRHEHDMEPDFLVHGSPEKKFYNAEKRRSSVLLLSQFPLAGCITKLQLEQERLGYEEALRLRTKINEEERQRIVIVQEEASSFNIEEWDKGKAIMDEDKTIQTKSKLLLEQEILGYEEALRLQVEIDKEERHRIARVQEEASFLNIEEWDDIQARVEADENYTLKQLKSYYFDEIKNLFETTMRRVHTFVLMEIESERVIPELAAGSSKRDAEEELVQERMNVEALQTKYPIIDWEIYTEGARKYWKIIRVGNHTERLYDTCGVHHVSTKDGVDIYMLVEREYPLSRGVLTQI
ncbi:hypothetical protein Tco_0713915 [Tanacetum coccineum]